MAPEDLLAQLLLRCKSQIQKLTLIVRKLDRGLDAKRVLVRKWAAVRRVLSSGTLKKYEDTLGGLKITLQTVQIVHAE